MELDSVTIFLLALAAIFLIGTVGEIVFQKTSIPDVIWLIVAGIVLGPVTGFLTREGLSLLAPYFAAITLVIVLFEGGSSLKLGELSQAAPRSTLLGLLAFLLSVLACTLITMMAAWLKILPATWSWTHGILTGAILGGTSSVVVMPAMAKAKLPPALANIINLESALTDAFCVVGTAAIIDVMTKDASEAASPGLALLRSFGIGLAVGLVAGVLWLLMLRFLKAHAHAYPITLAVLLILYVVIDRLGGSAALGILTTAIILGNAQSLTTKIGLAEPAELDKDVRGFHRQMAFMVKSFFFVFIGAMLGPPLSLIALGVVIGVMLLSARVPSVYAATIGTQFSEAEKKMMVVSMPRGMAAGVLATLPVSAGVEGTEGLPVVVFAAVFTTIMAFAIGFPLVKRSIPSVEPLVADGEAQPAAAASPTEPALPADAPAITAHDSATAAHDSATAAHDSATAAHDSAVAAHDLAVAAHHPAVAATPVAHDPGAAATASLLAGGGYAQGSLPDDLDDLPAHPADVFHARSFEEYPAPAVLPAAPSGPGLLRPPTDPSDGEP